MRIISDKVLSRKVSIALIILAAMAIIFLFAEHSPNARRIRTLKETSDRMEEQTHMMVNVELPMSQGEMSLAAEVESLWDAYQESHNTLLRKIPIVPGQGNLLENICQIAEAGGVEVVDMKSGDVGAGDGFSTIHVIIDVRCRFGKLGKFFKCMESMDRLVRVDNYDIRSDESYTGVLLATLEITGYIRSDN